jgi:serine/threonine protein kinase
MPLSAGSRLGPYEVATHIGSGSMGDVYLARDSRLRRSVALKVLPPAFASDPERVRRFEQEALAAAALNHPNILTVYDVGRQSDTTFVVSELLEGQPLRELLADGPLPVATVVGYARQIAEGLAAAHTEGIIHRDLKPENLFVTRDGRVKILDFGIARMTRENAASTAAPTMGPGTEPGIILGTVGYMAPEQVRGEPADHRADIFALGCVLFEMHTGQRAFKRDSPIETMTAILREDPFEPARTAGAVPKSALSRIIDRCLKKIPARRFQSAADLAFALESVDDVPAVAPKASGIRRALAPVVVLAAAAAGAAAALLWVPRDLASAEPVEFEVRVPEDLHFSSITDVSLPQIALSPDGRSLAFVGSDVKGSTLIWIRRLSSPTSVPVAGTDNASLPFWAPDSRQLGFFAEGKIKRVDPGSGAVQVIAEARGDPRGGTWGSDGTIVFAPGNVAGLYRVSAAGGTPSVVVPLDQARGESGHRWPHMLPDGRHFLFTSRAVPEHLGVYVASLDSPERTRLLPDPTNAAYDPAGYLLFVRGATLVAQRFDPERLQLIGEPVPVVDRIGYSVSFQAGSFSISQTRAIAHGVAGARGILTWFDRRGAQLGTVGETAEYLHPRLSPDGRQIAVARFDAANAGDIWLTDAIRGTATRFTFDTSNERFPVWSPDGSRVAFANPGKQTMSDIYVKSTRVTSAPELLIGSNATKFPTDWSRDGRWIVYNGLSGPNLWDLLLLDPASNQSQVLLSTTFNELGGQFSPDSKWIAYTSDESGAFEVYVQPFPLTGDRWRISEAGGMQPRWRADGRELFFVSADRKLMSVSLDMREGFKAAAATPLFDINVPSVAPAYANDYSVSPDGMRFLVNKRLAGMSVPPIRVILNWPAPDRP